MDQRFRGCSARLQGHPDVDHRAYASLDGPAVEVFRRARVPRSFIQAPGVELDEPCPRRSVDYLQLIEDNGTRVPVEVGNVHLVWRCVFPPLPWKGRGANGAYSSTGAYGWMDAARASICNMSMETTTATKIAKQAPATGHLDIAALCVLVIGSRTLPPDMRRSTQPARRLHPGRKPAGSEFT